MRYQCTVFSVMKKKKKYSPHVVLTKTTTIPIRNISESDAQTLDQLFVFLILDGRPAGVARLRIGRRMIKTPAVK